MAVEAAKLELSRRNVSEEEIAILIQELREIEAKIQSRKKKISEVESKAKSIGTEFVETVKPIQSEPQTIDRKINLMVIVFGL